MVAALDSVAYGRYSADIGFMTLWLFAAVSAEDD